MNRKSIFLTLFILSILSMHTSIANQEESIIWTYNMGTGIYATPVICNGVLYVGNNDGKFIALDAKTGDSLWTFNTGYSILSTPVIYGNTICFESYNKLYGLNLDGQKQWEYPLCEEHINYPWDFYHSSPVIVDSVAYIGTDKGLVYGIHIRNGEEVFKVQISDSSWSIRTTPEIYESKIFFANMNGVMYAYNLLTQELIWEYDTKNDVTFAGWDNHIQNTTKVFDGHVYFGGKHCHVYALDIEDGSLEWKWNCGQWIVGAPVIVDGVVYTGSSNQFSVYALNAFTGELLWQSLLDDRIFNFPMVDGDHVYAPSGSFFVLNKSDGAIEHFIDIPGNISSSIALNDSILYFASSLGTLFAVNQSKINNKPESNTIVTTNDLDLGDISNQQASLVDTSFYIYNFGDRKDSISISFSDVFQYKKIPDTVISIYPGDLFELPANDSIEVTISINVIGLQSGSYKKNMRIISQNNISQKIFKKAIQMNLVGSVSVDTPSATLPQSFLLNQNYPNPFNPSTIISYQLSAACHVKLIICNILGQELAVLVDELKEPGRYSQLFTKSDNLASGVYYYRLIAGKYQATKKMLVLK